jgi:hypothetical protein
MISARTMVHTERGTSDTPRKQSVPDITQSAGGAESQTIIAVGSPRTIFGVCETVSCCCRRFLQHPHSLPYRQIRRRRFPLRPQGGFPRFLLPCHPLYWLPFGSAAGSASSQGRTGLVRSAGSGNVVGVVLLSC